MVALLEAWKNTKMQETIIYEDILGIHTIKGVVIEEKGMYLSIYDGKNDYYIRKNQIKQRVKDNQVSIGCYV